MSWLSLLRHVPWTEVIANAPKVVDSARKLWDTTVGPPGSPEAASSPTDAPPTPEAQALTALQARMNGVEQATQTLREQMQASSGLMKALAEQNTQLIARLEDQDRQLRRLAYLAIAATLVALGTLGGMLLR